MVFQIGKNKNGTGGNMLEQATALYKMGSKALIFKNNPAKALKYFDRAITFLPYDRNILYLRGMAKSMLDDHEGAQADWNRIKTLGIKSESESNIQLITENSRMLN
jgi:tetratricopeptide (TPR) repeat protein